MAEAKAQPEKHQSGEPVRPSEITTLLTVGPEENLKSTEPEAGSPTLDLCEKLQQHFHRMKDQRPYVEKCFMERLNKLGIKPVSSYLLNGILPLIDCKCCFSLFALQIS